MPFGSRHRGAATRGRGRRGRGRGSRGGRSAGRGRRGGKSFGGRGRGGRFAHGKTKDNAAKYKSFVRVMGSLSKVALGDKVKGAAMLKESSKVVRANQRLLDKVRKKGASKKRISELAQTMALTTTDSSGAVVVDSMYDFFADPAFTGGGGMSLLEDTKPLVEASTHHSADTKIATEKKLEESSKMPKSNESSNELATAKKKPPKSQRIVVRKPMADGSSEGVVQSSEAHSMAVHSFASAADSQWRERRYQLEAMDAEKQRIAKEKKKLKNWHSLKRSTVKKIHQVSSVEKLSKVNARKKRSFAEMELADASSVETKSQRHASTVDEDNDDSVIGSVVAASKRRKVKNDGVDTEFADKCKTEAIIGRVAKKMRDGYRDHWVHTRLPSFARDIKPILDKRRIAKMQLVDDCTLPPAFKPKRMISVFSEVSSKSGAKRLKRKRKMAPISMQSELKYVALVDADSGTFATADECSTDAKEANESALIEYSDCLEDFLKSGYLDRGLYHSLCKACKKTDGIVDADDDSDSDSDIEASAAKRHLLRDASEAMTLSTLSTYKDVWLAIRNHDNDGHILRAVVSHCLNHVLRKQSQKKASHQRDDGGDNDDDDYDYDAEECGDGSAEARRRYAGFRRLSVLVICPFKETARRFASELLRVLPKRRNVQHERFQRFCELFGSAETRRLSTPKTGNAEFDSLFAGDTNDDFWSGIQVGRRGLVFCENWTNSDIMLISPLRLKLTLEMQTKGRAAKHLRTNAAKSAAQQKLHAADGMAKVFGGGAEEGSAKSGVKSVAVDTAADLLTSIEVAAILQLDVIEQQNVDHLLAAMAKVSRQPTAADSSVDYSTLRLPFVDGTAKYFRQNVFVSKHSTALTKSLFDKRALNVRGRIKVRAIYRGVIEFVIPNVRQVFHRFELPDDEDIGGARLLAFRNTVLPIFRAQKCVKTLIFVADYFDFLRLRNLYKNVSADRIGFLSEYCEDKEAKYLRSRFEAEEGLDYLVLTERFYFYNRVACFGAKRVVFCGLPQHCDYYTEALNWLQFATSSKRRTKGELDTRQFECHVLYSAFDWFALERVVGSQRAAHLLSHKSDTFTFT